MPEPYLKLVNYPYSNIVARSLDLPDDVCHENLQRVLHLLAEEIERMAPFVRKLKRAKDKDADPLLMQMISDHRTVESLYQRAQKRLCKLQSGVGSEKPMRPASHESSIDEVT